MSESKLAKKTWLDKFLDVVERVCNKLPQPAIMFIYLFGIVAVISCILGLLGVAATNPATGERIAVLNPISNDGLLWFLGSMLTNFTGFAPLGLVLTMTLAIGMCEESGFLTALLNDKLRNIPAKILPYVVAFIGVNGNIASDTAMVVIPPLAAILYIGVGKHPLVGMIAGYAGAQGGFSANLMIAGTDALLQGVTNTVLNGFLGEGVYEVDTTCNWYFMIASTFMCAIVIGAVCDLVVDKRMGKYEPPEGAEIDTAVEVTDAERKAMGKAGWVMLLYIILVVVGFFWGPLAKIDENGKKVLVGSPLIKNLIPVLFFLFFLGGLTYGLCSKSFKGSKDVAKAMTHQMQLMGSYVMFCFFAGQFNALFNWTNLGTVIAVEGATLLNNAGFTGFVMLVCVILVTGVINIFVPSGSAKWTILAPVFLPMLMLLDYHPGFIQLVYRLGDSPTNAFTPMSPYIWVVLGVAQAKYDKKAEIGTLIAGLFPIGIALQIAWIILLGVWMLLGFNVGPGVGIHLPEELAYLAIGA